ncbi:MAG TPA: efflux RND transporter periplasmic adaptor subunit [Candidatus Paceibacterota bacterium]|nr:efflux RND transporter periplasmic adaptor subunit [Candidatus Paceibacterota bacterium]
MKHQDRFIAFLKNHKYKTIAAVLVLIFIFFIASHKRSAPKFETAMAAVGNVVETVSVTGTVSPVGKADLSFEKSGVVSHIYVKVGDPVKAGDRIASLDSAADAASYESALATLADVSRGLRPEELSVEQAKVDVARVTLANAEKDAVNATHDAYAKAQSALVSYTDSLFSNPGSINPTINVLTSSYDDKTKIQNERVSVTNALSDWQNDLASASTTDAEAILTKSRAHLSIIKGFMTDLAAIVNVLTTANSGYSQTTLNGYTSAVNSALSAVNAAADSLTTAESSLADASSALTQANSSYSLKVAGNSTDSIDAQRAKADQAAAELAKDTIVSPIDGIITKAVPNEGEFVSPGTTEFSVQSIGDYKIEAYVPEADIAKVAVGDLSSTTLDAYGSDTYFEAKVAAIDPAETVIEGVPTYKVTLYFTGKDDRIRSGMTANLDILTHERQGVVAIPYRAVLDDNGIKTVRIANSAGTKYSTTTVVTGLKGSDGTIEIVSGIRPGDKVVTYVK